MITELQNGTYQKITCDVNRTLINNLIKVYEAALNGASVVQVEYNATRDSYTLLNLEYYVISASITQHYAFKKLILNISHTGEVLIYVRDESDKYITSVQTQNYVDREQLRAVFETIYNRNGIIFI